MVTSSLKPGDMVEVNKKGRRFYAIVRKTGRELELKPLERNVTWRTATSREVVGIWHANKRTASRLSIETACEHSAVPELSKRFAA